MTKYVYLGDEIKRFTIKFRIWLLAVLPLIIDKQYKIKRVGMEKELLEEADYQAITTNQTKIVEQLDKTNLLLSNTNDLSNKFVGEAIHNFKKGTEAIARIRNNLDEIHKALSVINKLRQQKA